MGETLPPGCTSGCGVATNNGTYPQVFNNDVVDSSFGITSKIFLDQITPFGFRIGSLEVPNNAQFRFPFDRNQSQRDQMVTSFSSKSELALNLSTDHRSLTFMGYVSPIDALDVSNSNTPGVVDPTNPVSATDFRAVAQVDALGRFHFTATNAYSGNNGRAAIFNNDADAYYTAGNAGNGSNPQPVGIIFGSWRSVYYARGSSAVDAESGNARRLSPVFNITELPANKKPDKVGKDDNFRGLTIFNNVVYYTKGSGGNGIDTVYFVDTTGSACPNGVGLPSPPRLCRRRHLATFPATVADLRSAEQHVHPERLQYDAGQDFYYLLSFRNMVRKRQHSLRGR